MDLMIVEILEQVEVELQPLHIMIRDLVKGGKETEHFLNIDDGDGDGGNVMIGCGIHL